MIQECGFFDDDEEEEEDDFDNEDYSNLDIPLSHEVYVLIIKYNIIDLNNHVFTGKQGEYNNNNNNSDDDDEVSKVLFR